MIITGTLTATQSTPDGTRWLGYEAAARRLGALLAARRGQLGYGPKLRKAFAQAAGLSDKTIARIESGERPPFAPEMRGRIEVAYDLVHGSLERTIAGGPLEPAGRDRFEETIMASNLDAEQKAEAILAWRRKGREMLDDLGINDT